MQNLWNQENKKRIKSHTTKHGIDLYKFQFVFDDGKIIECDSDRNELIESISKYLISKGVFNK